MIPIKHYELYLIDNEIGENTQKNYLNTIKQLDQFLTRNELELTKETLIQFKQFMRTYYYRPGRMYTTKTINQKIISINVYLNWLLKEEIIDEKMSIKLLKSQTKEHRESITELEYKKLLKHSGTEEMKLFILLIGNTGVRISEACAIKVEDLAKKTIQIENKGKQRMITVPQFLKKQLKSYTRKNNITGVIFYRNQRTYRSNLKTIAGHAKVNKDKVYPHSIRHYFAKAFLNNGGDSTVLQQLLGHEQIATTTIYTKLSTNELSEQFSQIKNI